MKAIEVTAYGDPSVLRVAEQSTPVPEAGEVRIRIRAAGVNFADIMQRRGNYRDGPEPPYVAGLEAAGVIDAVGAGVNRREGERVVALIEGGYAEYATVDARQLLDIPAGMDWLEAAGFPVQFITAHNCLFEWGELQPDESVLIHAAAGGVGTAAVQLANAANVEIFGTASTTEKLALAAELGVDYPINYQVEDFVDVITKRTGSGVDLILDGIGGETTERSIASLRPFGKLVTYGAAAGFPGNVQTTDLFFTNKRAIGYHLGHGLRHRPESVMAAVPELTEHLETGDVSVQIGETFPLTEASTAHERIERRQTTGKIVLVP